MHDLVIRGGLVVDGTGAPARTADVAIDQGLVVEVGLVSGSAKRTLDADGLLVTPGFVDVHTHYDAQATWDPHLTPSCWHGVTTAVAGNCGVGFAPAAPDRHQWLIGLMEGVEDIPGAALAEGIRWDWETFPEYLDALDRAPHALDVGTQVTHGAVRAYVMGERGAANEASTEADIEAMSRIVEESVRAGALGFSSSRTMGHRAVDGRPVPGTFAREDELWGIGRALERAGMGIFELAPNGAGGDAAGDGAESILEETDWAVRLSAAIHRPVSFVMLQYASRPDIWREVFARADKGAALGAEIFPQIAGRPFGILAGHQTIANPFVGRPSYDALASLPLAERARRMRDLETRRRILSEKPVNANLFGAERMYENVYQLGNPPDYEPSADASIGARARREGRSTIELVYDLMLEDDARELLLFPYMNYVANDLEPQREMMLHPRSILGLGDGGAHCGLICDASIPTFMLAHWVRDRKRGDKLPLEFVIEKLTRGTARLYGLFDRGVLAPGYKGDVNLIDYDRIALRRPEMAYDLPAGARRLLQRSDGYVSTIVSGEEILRNGEFTGALPGRLIRGAQAAPHA
jgi:N-acyl-D-aspartate/D-glutamate deacylase